MNRQFVKAFYEEKFIVINKEHLKIVPDNIVKNLKKVLSDLSKHIPKNKYYVCNQDETYANEIIDIILKNESNKAN